MERPIRKTLCRPINHVDEVDCAINWEAYDCPGCGGTGIARYSSIGPEHEEEADDCDECDGSGQVAVLKR